MRKPKHRRPEPAPMAPWGEHEDTTPNDTFDQIPTYRKQIVQKFLGKIHTKSRVSPLHASGQRRDSSDQSTTMHGAIDKKITPRAQTAIDVTDGTHAVITGMTVTVGKSRSLKLREGRQYSRSVMSKTEVVVDRRDNLQILTESLVTRQVERRRQQQSKTHIVTIGTDFQELLRQARGGRVRQSHSKDSHSKQSHNKDSHNKSIRSSKSNQQQLNISFTKKLRLKDLLANKKNIQRVKNPANAQSAALNILKNPHSLYDLWGQSAPVRAMSAYQAARGKKRSVSQQDNRYWQS